MTFTPDYDDEHREQIDRLIQEFAQLDKQEQQIIVKTENSLRHWIARAIQSIFGLFGYFDDIVNEIQSIIEETLRIDDED